MSRRLLATSIAVLAGAALAIALGLPAGIVGEVLLSVALVVAAVRLLSGGRAGPDPFELALPDRSAPRHDPQADLRRKVRVSMDSAIDAHRLLRPILRETAAARLRHHGIDLDTDPEPSRHALGERLYEFVRPDRPRPDDDGPAWHRTELQDAVRRLEDL